MSLLLSRGKDAINTPVIPSSIDIHSTTLTFLLDKNDDIRLMNRGLRAIASAVIPAVMNCKAKMKIPKYNAVLKLPKIMRCLHSIPTGNLWDFIR